MHRPLCVLVAPPGFHMTRHFGVVATVPLSNAVDARVWWRRAWESLSTPQWTNRLTLRFHHRHMHLRREWTAQTRHGHNHESFADFAVTLWVSFRVSAHDPILHTQRVQSRINNSLGEQGVEPNDRTHHGGGSAVRVERIE